MSDTKATAVVEVLASDLHGPGVVFCPNPKQALWSGHPKVYIDLSHDGEGKCTYRGTVYSLKDGEKINAHH